MGNLNVLTDGATLTVDRLFNAPLKDVWDAWTVQEQFKKWWGPRGWTTTVKHFDFSVGGYMHYGMKCEDPAQGEWFGKTSWGKFVYESINNLDSITYTDYFVDENCVVDEQMPATKTVMKFEQVSGGTRIISSSEMASEEALKQLIDMQMIEGLKQTWDRLEEMLEVGQ